VKDPSPPWQAVEEHCLIKKKRIMEKRKVKAFFNDQVDTHRKVICVFSDNVLEEQMKEVVADYLREHEYDDEDDSAPLHTWEEIEETVENIVNGGVFDCDMDRYFMDEVVMIV
jgi:hypothetical protein